MRKVVCSLHFCIPKIAQCWTHGGYQECILQFWFHSHSSFYRFTQIRIISSVSIANIILRHIWGYKCEWIKSLWVITFLSKDIRGTFFSISYTPCLLESEVSMRICFPSVLCFFSFCLSVFLKSAFKCFTSKLYSWGFQEYETIRLAKCP